jgi:hypothetical protein
MDSRKFFIIFRIIIARIPEPKENAKRFIKCANWGEKLLKRTKIPFVRGLQFEANRVLKEITFGEGFITSDRDIWDRVLKFAKSSQTKEKDKLFE